MTLGLTDNTIKSILDTLVSLQDYYREPITLYKDCDKEKLFTALRIPFQRPLKSDPRKDFIEKAAELFYLLIEDHPLVNGNKRLATLSLLVMARLNNLRIDSTDKKIYHLAMKVATKTKEGGNKENITKNIRKFIQENLDSHRTYNRKLLASLKLDFKRFLFAK